MLHVTEEWCKIFDKILTFDSKSDMRNLMKFNASSYKSENLMYYFCQEYIKFQLKKYRRMFSREHERALKSLKDDTLRALFVEGFNVSFRIFQRNYMPWHWRVM